MKTREQSFDAHQFVINCIDGIGRAYRQNRIEDGLALAKELFNRFLDSRLSRDVWAKYYSKLSPLVDYILAATSLRYPAAKLVGAQFSWCEGALDEALSRFEALNKDYPNYLEGYLQHRNFLVKIYPRGERLKKLEHKIRGLKKNADDKPNAIVADPLFGYSLFEPCLSSAMTDGLKDILSEAAKSADDLDMVKNNFCTIS